MIEVVLVQQYGQAAKTQQLIDCKRSRRMDILNDTVMGDDGLPVDPAWIDMGLDDPLVKTACRG